MHLEYKPEHFSAKEFWRISRMSSLFLFMLDKIRHKAGIAIPCSFVVHSSNNPKEKHAPKSKHYTNAAADFHIVYKERNSMLDYKFTTQHLLDTIGVLGFRQNMGIGIYPHWNNPGFHLDYRQHGCIWTRNDKGKYTIISLEEALG